jgi:tetratricopeptide (TPR) repeat protein/transcriptional regulator with XRE-family HTH domain
VAEQAGLAFAGLLRQLRAEARLTQEELAEAAGLSPRSVSDLERGIHRTAHKHTAGLLAEALGLAGPVRTLFVAAARGRAPAAETLAARQGVAPGTFAAAATRTLPRDTASFTGRQNELARLLGAIDGVAEGGGVVGIHAIDGMAGIGKTTFAVHAAHRLAGAFPDGQFFLPLHAHTPGQRPVGPVDALASLLLTAGVPMGQIPPGLEARAARWRDHVAGRKILLLLDDAVTHEQVRSLLPGTAGSLVLVTSRRRLTALEDATVISLDVLPAGEAAVLLARLAARPSLRAGDAAVDEITRFCGYLPLAIGMAARKLSHHPAWSAGQLAAELAEAHDRLAVMEAENLSVAAAFGLSYQGLTPGQQRLFRRLGLVPGPSIDAYAARALDGTSLDEARRNLNELYDQHLIDEPAAGRFVLHDLLREHASALVTADDPVESGAATGRLLDYYLHAAVVAGQHFPSLLYRLPPPGRPPADAPGLSTFEQASAWLEAERPNLHAAADHAAAAGRHPHAVRIPAAMSGFLLAHGHVDESVAMHRTAVAAARRAEDGAGQAVALGELGVLAWLTGDHPAAVASLARALALYRDIGDLADQAHILDQLAEVHVLVGDYPAATASVQQALALARCSGDRLAEAEALNHLGQVQQRTGDYLVAAATQQQALAGFREIGNRLGQASALIDLGIVQEETGDYRAAAASQQEALRMFRDLGIRLGQAVALNKLGVVQQLTGDYRAASASLQQSLDVHRGLGSRFGQAQALNSLGELSSRTSATQQARERHTQALAIACDIGMPLEEARALEGIGHSYLQDGTTDEGAAHLRQALAIYQRIGAPGARRVQETLRHYEF